MRLPEDYDDHSSMTPTVIMTIVAVTAFVGAILIMVLMMNNDTKNGSLRDQLASEEVQGSSPVVLAPDVDELLTGSTLLPEDLDFWDKYPPKEPEEPSEETPPPQEAVENDPATDGKHTLVQYSNGKEEWVLISPYLPKHEYDFTRLVCQSDLMKYYVDGRQTSYVGVDISKVQDYVDFVKVKKSGINFVMLRAGARGYGTGQLIVDDYFNDNLKRATDAGLEVGVYFFSQAITKEEAVEEANMVLENLGEYQISYPIAFDMEFIENDQARIDSLSKADKTAIAKAFLDTIAAAGYKTMLYGNKEWLIKEIDMSKLTAYDVWLSQLTDVPDYPYQFTMWQYSTQGSVDGIAGAVNMNISFIDYSEK
ncbi:MAG: Lyzozyme M1 (1,4-beta-N-acetylmuramidase) [Lachnospiraceae bacterium]|jgi:GH25 family lysozyme M1 (1,4-beta-N-acetylmuramidase)|nr:Lyzozyme M1 (1,4-beta-N-acetylmuramidase) [Lachnospiraceae bacterium]